MDYRDEEVVWKLLLDLNCVSRVELKGSVIVGFISGNIYMVGENLGIEVVRIVVDVGWIIYLYMI